MRHCILATAGEARDAADAERLIMRPLHEAIKHVIDTREVNPWCGLCGSAAETWAFEIGRTAFRSMSDATPTLVQNQLEQTVTRIMWGDMKRND